MFCCVDMRVISDHVWGYGNGLSGPLCCVDIHGGQIWTDRFEVL